jgi:hypothetical protein
MENADLAPDPGAKSKNFAKKISKMEKAQLQYSNFKNVPCWHFLTFFSPENNASNRQ